MRASYMSINRVDVQQAVKEVARFMSEPNEGAWIMLKRLVRYFVGHGRLVQVISEQRYHLGENDYSFDALQACCFRINLKL